MTGLLKVDTEAVRSVSQDLTRITTELTDAQANSDDVADAVGHSGLAGALRNFAGSWDDRRRELIDQIGQMRDAATSIADTFDETDAALAHALTAPPPTPMTPSNPGPAGGTSAV